MRNSFTVEQFDLPNSTAMQWQALHRFRHERIAADDLGEPSLPDDRVQAHMQRQWPLTQYYFFAMWEQGRMVANLEFSVRRPGTEHYEEHAQHLDAWIGVAPQFQGQGRGRCMMDVVRKFMREHGKTKLRMNARTPAGHAFLKAMGGEQMFLKMKNKLTLSSVDWRQMQAWQQGFAHGLHWEVHVSRVPLTRWETLVEPLSALLADAPKDQLDAPPMRYEMPAVRAWYAELDKTGGAHYMVLLRESAEENSRILAVSNAEWSPTTAQWASQALTATVRHLRGKGLAKAVKARLLEIVHSEHAQVRWVTTYNAHSNAAMLAINRQMGFEVMREIGTYQFRV
jgi:GNAT superfamily N-acetyltransferase